MNRPPAPPVVIVPASLAPRSNAKRAAAPGFAPTGEELLRTVRGLLSDARDVYGAVGELVDFGGSPEGEAAVKQTGILDLVHCLADLERDLSTDLLAASARELRASEGEAVRLPGAGRACAAHSAAAPSEPLPFDPACRFLLVLAFENLFDPTNEVAWFRCKGCTARVRVQEREEHYRMHQRSEPRS